MNGGLPGQHLVEQAPCGIEIAPGVDGLAAGLFRREVLRGPHHGLRLGHGRGGVRHGTGNPEVHDLHAVGFRAEHHVGRFDVAVHNPGFVAVVEGGEHAQREVDRLVDADVFGPDHVPDCLPGDEFHDDVRHPDGVFVVPGDGVVPGVIDGNDRGMVQGGHRLRLALEPGLELGVPGQVRTQQFDGHGASEAGVQAAEDVGHAAAPDQLTQLIAPAEDALGVHGAAVLPVRWGAG